MLKNTESNKTVFKKKYDSPEDVLFKLSEIDEQSSENINKIVSYQVCDDEVKKRKIAEELKFIIIFFFLDS